ncbi:hypothetical protein QBZ16_001215 [Prototheca wickerhamii]|uniref:Glutaredoxin domain-containing protein n=1 Tax=Prototheca wickerhamii TaxID=3111 RepID=A0AAD9IE07_PROWI|nr:hypothetical protein QBZ16_001215 [Prototheca wickerhamii]
MPLLRVSLETHKEGLPELVHSVRLLPVPGADREQLAPLWRAWVQQAVAVSGGLPPGNASPEQQKRWQRRHVPRPKAELRLTPGKGADKLTVSVDELVAGAIGEPFEVVDVLDEVHNPGVREAIKRHSEWPTLPQVIFVEGEFIGGADIVEQMHAAGQLAELMGR